MRLCCTAKTPSNSTFMINAVPNGPWGPESIVLGTTQFPMKPIAYKKVPKKAK